MNLGLDIYIPKTYIADENLRLTFDEKIASASTTQRIDGVRNEMRDRFGALPTNVGSLFRIVQVKHLAQSLGVISITRDGARGIVKLSPKAKVDPGKLLDLIQADSRIKFSPSGVLSFPLKAQAAKVVDAIEELLRNIA